MLKFLKEDAGAIDRKPNNSSAGDIDASGEGKSQEEGYLTITPKDKSIKRGTILLAVVFGVGLVSLLVMIRKTSPSAVTAEILSEEARIETAISKLTGIKTQFLNRMDQIVKKFHEFSNVKQVEVHELQKNPFTYEKHFKPLAGEAEFQDDLESSQSAVIQSRLLRRVEKMQLLSIMETSNGRCCMIDDVVAHVGDYVNGFRVAAIRPASVELRAEGMQFVLRIPLE